MPNASAAPGYSLSSRTVFHAYQLRLFDPQEARTFRSLNRFYQILDGRVYGIGPNENIRTVVSLRYTHDFGTSYPRSGFDPSQLGPSDETLDFQIDYMYLDWRNVITGLLDLRFGRQLILDELDWYSLDGLKATARFGQSGQKHRFELYAGRAVPFGAFLSSDPYINDGIELSDGPSFAIGGAYSGEVGQDLSFALAYRHELRLRSDPIEVLGVPADQPEAMEISDASAGKIGLQEVLLAGSVGYVIRPVDIDLYARGTWNFLFQTLDQARAGLAYNPSRYLHWAAEYFRVFPRFAGDSIFNIFNIFPYDRIRTEFDWQLTESLRIEAGYFLQHMYGGPTVAGYTLNPDNPYEPADSFLGSSRSHGPSGGIRFERPRWGLGAYGEAATNVGGNIAYGGNFRRAEVFGHLNLLGENTLRTTLRAAFTGFQNDWFERADYGEVQDEERSYSLDAGVWWKVYNHVFFRGNIIKNFSSYLEGSYRVFSSVEVRYQ
ncbi:MAG: hypothetical protein VYC39_15275 [Myxococcota bacterium]|nr:hypothetical protein [Myxococcota bacterium]